MELLAELEPAADSWWRWFPVWLLLSPFDCLAELELGPSLLPCCPLLALCWLLPFVLVFVFGPKWFECICWNKCCCWLAFILLLSFSLSPKLKLNLNLCLWSSSHFRLGAKLEREAARLLRFLSGLATRS